MDYYERAGLTPVPGEAGLRPGRLRLHHLHRQQRAAARAHLRCRRPRRTWRWCRCCPATATSRAASAPTCRMNYLASPPLVVAYALAGSMDVDLDQRPARHGHGRPARLPPRHLAVAQPRWPRRSSRRSSPRCSRRPTSRSTTATSAGRAWTSRPGDAYEWDATSTYVRKPPYFEGMAMTPAAPGGRARRPGAGQAGRQRHHRPHLAGGQHPPGRPGRALAGRRRRASRRTSTPTARGAATTRS